MSREHGWEENWNDFEKIALCHSELSEAIEELRDGHEPGEIHFTREKPEGYPIELADTVIRIMHICGHHGIDLATAIKVKMEYNQTREYRHGGKIA
jgi:NTP pyrophosphatase (non-canonical NTP hydrolase)